jgi:PAS domain S-box-containing protein
MLEQRLRISDERFRIAFDDSPIGMFISSPRPDQVGQIIKVNRAFCQLVGRSEHQLVVRSDEDILLADAKARVVALHQRLLAGRSLPSTTSSGGSSAPKAGSCGST